jgi:hypothetical protein
MPERRTSSDEGLKDLLKTEAVILVMAAAVFWFLFAFAGG